LAFEKVGKNPRQVECLIFRRQPQTSLSNINGESINVTESFDNSTSILSACDSGS